MPTTLKNEVQKIVRPLAMGEVFVGNSAYIKLGDVKIRVDLYNTFSRDNYDALMLRAINAKTGEVDTNVVKFANLFGKKPTTNPNFRDGIYPHIWIDREVDWYVYHPTSEDYKRLTKEVEACISIFE